MINLSRFGFKKTEIILEKYEEYILESLPDNYRYYKYITLHIPTFEKVEEDISINMSIILAHREKPNQCNIQSLLDKGLSKFIYFGYIDSEDYFEKLLSNLGLYNAAEKE